MPRRSATAAQVVVAPPVAELAARSCEVDARDLAARLRAMRVGDQISVPCCATIALPGSDRRFFHCTSWDCIIGILRQGFVGQVHHDRAQGVPLTYEQAPLHTANDHRYAECCRRRVQVADASSETARASNPAGWLGGWGYE